MHKVENKKWCSYHQEMESIDNFQKNICKPSGLQDCCRTSQNKYMEFYNDSHRSAINEKSIINQEYRLGKITK